MSLRPYQQHAFEAALSWIKTCVDPCIIGAATGSGKSHIVAALAESIHKMSGKKILCLAPSAELVEQNHEKYLATGNPASIYSASLGRKDMAHAVVFGTPQTVSNQIRRFGSSFAAVIVDEAHGVTPTLMRIIDHMKSQNPKLRVIGLSATPFRLGSGYIYQNHYLNGRMQEAIDPFFHTMVYDIGARQLIDEGYLTPPSFESTPDHYDTSGLKLSASGSFTQSSLDKAFSGRGRKTAGIVADVVEKSRYRKGVMIFAATVQHAEEVMESLPPSLSAVVTGSTSSEERRGIIKAFKEKRIKYLVNISVLTTGFDSAHVDVVAIMRSTESVSLLQQIIGRGLRLCEDKEDCLILDYAENIERHCPGGDVFDPNIVAKVAAESEPMNVTCPLCTNVNKFGARKNDEGYNIDDEGYFTDLAGNRIEVAEGKPLPSHYGRRCQGETISGGHHQQCTFKWSFKECPECAGENDIAARYCTSCKCELVDPNEKLKEVAAKVASDPYRLRIAPVTGWQLRRWPGRDDKPDTLRVDYYVDETPHTVSEWYAPESSNSWMRSRWHSFCERHWGESLPDIDAVIDGRVDAKTPKEVAFKKKQGSKFFEVKGVEA